MLRKIFFTTIYLKMLQEQEQVIKQLKDKGYDDQMISNILLNVILDKHLLIKTKTKDYDTPTIHLDFNSAYHFLFVEIQDNFEQLISNYHHPKMINN